jgi:3-hydroxybutyryl-CoA dehydrogenase
MQIKKVGVLGMGTQGQGIVEICARAGLDVLAITRSQDSLTRGLDQVRTSMLKAIKKGRLTETEMDIAWDRIRGAEAPEDFQDCDIVFEAVPEMLDLKKETLKLYDGICKPETIFATDTSTLPIIDLAVVTGRADRVIGTHFFWPVPVMRLVEVVVSILTSEETAETTIEFARLIGKEPSRVKDSPGFITSYLLVGYSLEAIRLYERGVASMEDIDNAVEKGLNYPMGPFKLNDMAGIDTLYYSQRSLWEMTKNPVFAPVLTLDKLMAAGHLGRKTGKGFYDYPK